MVRTPTVHAWHLCISGFTQTEGQLTGLMRLCLELGIRHNGPRTRVELRKWNDDWSDVAEFIWLTRPNGASGGPRVNVYAYSWGAGWGFTQLAQQLRQRQIEVSSAVLCDPVYRSRWLSMQWRSLWGHPVIRVPDNVHTVWSCYQTTNKPAGHPLVADDPSRTRILPAVHVPGVTHQYMDDTRMFFERSLEVADAH